MLRYLPVALLSFFCSVPLFSQVEFGGFFSAAGTWTTINSSGGVMPSAGLGLIVNRRFILGGSLGALIPTIKADSLDERGRSLFIDLFFWQVRGEYIHNPDDFFQYGAGLSVGRGSLGFRTGSADHSSPNDLPSYSLTTLEPEFAAELALADAMHLRAAAGWRILLDRDPGSEPAGDLNGPLLTLGFRIGWFGERM